MNIKPRLITSTLMLVALAVSGCSIDSAKNHYLLAEKLWNDRKYSAAVIEFDKVSAKDPKSKLGLQATFRSAMTQFLFLSQYSEAFKKLQTFVQLSQDPALVWNAKIQMGEILFSKLEQYPQTIQHYQNLIQEKPKGPDVPEFLYRIAKSQFFLTQFGEAIQSYRSLIKQYPTTEWAEKAYYEIGVSYFTWGESSNRGKSGDQGFETAIEAFEKFIKLYPKSSLVPSAKFEIACCLEELDELEEALQAFKDLKGIYPSPQVIEVKLARIRERMTQRKRSR